MAAIDTEKLYNAIVRKFSIGANSLTRFQASFLGAYNDVLMELFNDRLIDEPTLLTDLDDDSEVEERYLPQVKTGLRFFLQTSGEWVKGDDIDKYAGLEWERAKGVIANSVVARSQADETYTGFWSE